LSTDGTQLFAGLDGAGAVRQVNLTTGAAGVQFSLGGGPGVYDPPYASVSLAAGPCQPTSVAVYGTNGVVTIFDSGVARAKTSSGLETYFVQNRGALTFGSDASTLYVAAEAIGSYLYKLTIDSTGRPPLRKWVLARTAVAATPCNMTKACFTSRTALP
jgi:trimeric autotransporter adhesin